ncbi:MAG: hypothetical protein C3F11_22065 [Methylocystaceae bacterium]|nr:MAG: hypothetical protein C3F11_22065 [Methylocystaceae bacterium]
MNAVGLFAFSRAAGVQATLTGPFAKAPEKSLLVAHNVRQYRHGGAHVDLSARKAAQIRVFRRSTDRPLLFRDI